MAEPRTFALTAPGLSDDTRLTRLGADEVPMGSMAGNFGRENPDFATLLFAVEEPGTKDKEDHLAEPFAVRYWCAKKTELVAQATQELTASVRLVLISPDMETLAFNSTGAIESWDLVRAIHGDGPYDPPVKVLVHPVKTRTGRTMIRLRLAK
jgi:hypothetical protein